MRGFLPLCRIGGGGERLGRRKGEREPGRLALGHTPRPPSKPRGGLCPQRPVILCNALKIPVPRTAELVKDQQAVDRLSAAPTPRPLTQFGFMLKYQPEFGGRCLHLGQLHGTSALCRRTALILQEKSAPPGSSPLRVYMCPITQEFSGILLSGHLSPGDQARGHTFSQLWALLAGFHSALFKYLLCGQCGISPSPPLLAL